MVNGMRHGGLWHLFAENRERELQWSVAGQCLYQMTVQTPETDSTALGSYSDASRGVRLVPFCAHKEANGGIDFEHLSSLRDRKKGC